MISEQEMLETQDTEITLGTSKLVAIFVGAVVICAVFFAFGFMMGRNSVKSSLTLTEPPEAEQPSAAVSKPTPTAVLRPTPVAAQQAPAPATEEAKPAESAPVTAIPTEGKPGTGYVVQIAAVSKQEDADALEGALKKKGYPVFVADGSGDKLFHVQVGPFGDIKDAEAMRTRLTGDGYNPILKR